MTDRTIEKSERLLNLPSESATVRLGERLAALSHAGDTIALSGELGVGKTRLARAFIGALMEQAEEVPSPTFTLVQTYDTLSGMVWHFDLYRLDHPDQVFELGFEEALAEGIALIEWPERLHGLLPRDRLDVALDFDPSAEGARTARLAGYGNWIQRMAELPADV